MDEEAVLVFAVFLVLEMSIDGVVDDPFFPVGYGFEAEFVRQAKFAEV